MHTRLRRTAIVLPAIAACLLSTNANAATAVWTKKASVATAVAIPFETLTQTPAGATVMEYVTGTKPNSSGGTVMWRVSSKTGWAAAHKVGSIDVPLRIVRPSIAASNTRVITLVPVTNAKTQVVTLTLRAQTLAGRVLFTRQLATGTQFADSSVSVDSQNRVMVLCITRDSHAVSAYAVSAAGHVSARKDLQVATSKDGAHDPYSPQAASPKAGQFVAAWLQGLGESTSGARYATVRSATYTSGKWAKATTRVPTEKAAEYLGLSAHAGRAVLAYTAYRNSTQEHTALRAIVFHSGTWGGSKLVSASFDTQGVGVGNQSVANNGTAEITADHVYTLKAGASSWSAGVRAPSPSNSYCSPFIGLTSYQVNTLHWYAAVGSHSCTLVNYAR